MGKTTALEHGNIYVRRVKRVRELPLFELHTISGTNYLRARSLRTGRVVAVFNKYEQWYKNTEDMRYWLSMLDYVLVMEVTGGYGVWGWVGDIQSKM